MRRVPRRLIHGSETRVSRGHERLHEDRGMPVGREVCVVRDVPDRGMTRRHAATPIASVNNAPYYFRPYRESLLALAGPV